MAKKRVSKGANPRAGLALENPPSASEGCEENGAGRRVFPFVDVAGCAAIFFATLITYLPALSGSLLWDDSAHVTRPDLRSWHGLWRIWFELGATQQYYPLLHTAFWTEHRFWGDAVAGYHLTNIALHALSACLVVTIVRRLAIPGAWVAGFIFALHPVLVEGVAWISEQKSTLSGVFCLAALLVYLEFDQSRRRSRYVLATVLFVLALLTKTVTATLPAALLVIFWWKRGRIEWRRDVLPLIPWLAMGASAGLFTAWVERTLVGAQGSAYLLTPAQRVLVAGRALWFYASKLVWPVNLTFSYPHWKIDGGVWWQSLFPLSAVALAIGLGLAARRSRAPLACLLLFAGTLFPVLGFLNVYPFRYSWVADHFQYLASLAIIVPVSAMLSRLRYYSAILLVVLGVLTWRQSRDYRDIETLYRATIQRNPESWLAHNNLGAILFEKPRRLQDAIAEYQAALRIEPDYPETHNNMGTALLRISGRQQDALAEYETALRLKPDYADAHNGLGLALSRIPGRMQDAIAEYRAAIRINPKYAAVHNNLGSALAQDPRGVAEAVEEYRAALRIDPDYAEAHYNQGFLFARMPGRLPDAIEEFQAALRIKPDYAEAHSNLGSALAHVPGRLQDAIAEYQAALRIRPDYAEAHNNLGSALIHVPGRTEEGMAEYRTALRLRPDFAEAHNNIGNAFMQMPGRIPDAIAEYRAALQIQPNLAEVHYNLGLGLAQSPGRLQDAIAEYREALRIKPDYADAHFSLGSALTHVPGQLRPALAEFEAVLKINPDSQPARQAMGQIQAALK